MKRNSLSEEHKRKISNTLKEKYKDGYIRSSTKGIKFSKEHNRKLSETRKRLFKEGKLTTPRYWLGKNWTAKNEKERRMKISNTLKTKYANGEKKKYWLNKKQSKDSIEKRRQKMVGHKVSKETIEKIINSKIKNNTLKHTEEQKQKLKEYYAHNRFLTGESFSKEHRQKIRLKKIKYIQECLNKGLPIHPTIGKTEEDILKWIESIIGVKIIRQYYIKGLGYWLDGYIPRLNLAIEIDEPYHFVGNKLREKDLKRQREIENFLDCVFFRYKSNHLKIQNANI